MDELYCGNQINSAGDETPDGKLAYRSPRLQYFGAVTDLTNNFTGTCKDDGISQRCGTGNMGVDEMV